MIYLGFGYTLLLLIIEKNSLFNFLNYKKTKSKKQISG